jgi:hypothetical protein
MSHPEGSILYCTSSAFQLVFQRGKKGWVKGSVIGERTVLDVKKLKR